MRYLLVGKVRWDEGLWWLRAACEVSPELVEVDERGRTSGQQSFDAPLTDVFQVQADIAGKVAQQLKVALTPAVPTDARRSGRRRTSTRTTPTSGAGTLTAEAIAPVIQRRAAAAFGEAVERDSTFALAWAALADAYSVIYFNGVPTPAVGDSAHMAAAKAVALAPDLPEAHAAMGFYYLNVPDDVAQALAEYTAALAHSPNNVTSA